MGFVVGTLRGRRLKRFFYTTTGLGIGTGLCHPQQTQELVSSLSHSINSGEIPQLSLPKDVTNIVKPEDITAFLNTVMDKVTKLYHSVVDALQSSTTSNLTVEKDTKYQSSTIVEKDTKVH